MVSPFVYAGVNFKLRNVSTKIEGNDQKEVSLYSTNMIKTVAKLYLFIENKELSFNRIRPALFGVPWPGGGGLQKPPLHKSGSIDAIDMKLGGLVEHY